MEELIKRLERVIAIGAPNKDGQHPISAEVVLEVVKEQLGTNLASLGTDAISRQAAIDILRQMPLVEVMHDVMLIDKAEAMTELMLLPPAQPETTRRIVGKSKGGMTLWYECERCGEPVDEGDKFCRSCGRRFIKNHG